MRLVCPSCKANYEVPRTAVPIGGREVQCASCGHKWFQTRTKKTTDEKPTQLDSKSSEENNIELFLRNQIVSKLCFIMLYRNSLALKS